MNLATRKGFLAAVAAIALIAAIRVASTHRTFSAVIDEPAHIAAGFEWLSGSYKLDAEHPPLARVLAAIPFHLMGAPQPVEKLVGKRGNEVLLYEGHYTRNIALARLGNLAFLVLAIFAVAFWAALYLGEGGGIIAAALYSLLPPVLGHAGVATTDMAAAAFLPLAFYAFAKRSWLLGPAIGLGMLAKLSFVIFFAAGALVIVALQRFRPRIVVPLLVAIAIVWAGYRFELNTLERAGYRALEKVEYVFGAPGAWFARHIPIPAPSFVIGLVEVKLHDVRGHAAFLLGEKSSEGWWYYFPVALFFKTPLPLLLLFALGARHVREPALVAAAILAIAMTASINIGVRHLLPMYAPMAIAAVAAFRHRIVAFVLLVWLAVNSALAHPDHIAWFNETARHPERILADSNLDWGQDVLRLRARIRERGITSLHGAIFASAPLRELGIEIAEGRSDGWVVVSETTLAMTGSDFEYLQSRPYERVGKTIRLYPPE